ncbi:8129_t:CDS:2 [Funneliformis geosporum]|uniref:8129_t:CDS:1 n=1 Tax=Funneliformis geosporum TaxID=1117311 RepID=A0A9W4SG09_9GLOM|nr:8129_t:CDS:2 [Funneliformis geosporum]
MDLYFEEFNRGILYKLLQGKYLKLLFYQGAPLLYQGCTLLYQGGVLHCQGYSILYQGLRCTTKAICDLPGESVALPRLYVTYQGLEM